MVIHPGATANQSSVLLFYATFDLLLALCSFIIYVSTVVRSRTLLLTSSLATLSYIGYYTGQYFADTLGWPVALIILGLVLIGLSSLALRLNRKYRVT